MPRACLLAGPSGWEPNLGWAGGWARQSPPTPHRDKRGRLPPPRPPAAQPGLTRTRQAGVWARRLGCRGFAESRYPLTRRSIAPHVGKGLRSASHGYAKARRPPSFHFLWWQARAWARPPRCGVRLRRKQPSFSRTWGPTGVPQARPSAPPPCHPTSGRSLGLRKGKRTLGRGEAGAAATCRGGRRCHGTPRPSGCPHRGRRHGQTDGRWRHGAPAPGAGELHLVGTGASPVPSEGRGPRPPFRRAAASQRLRTAPAASPSVSRVGTARGDRPEGRRRLDTSPCRSHQRTQCPSTQRSCEHVLLVRAHNAVP